MEASTKSYPERTKALPTRALRLVLAYDGTDFCGWQIQPGLRTIQGELARAITIITGEHVLPQGSGRTDAGVHAEAQVVSLSLQAAIPAERLVRALNRRLPPAIRVLAAQDAAPDFHARAGVLSKTYEYRIFLRYPLLSAPAAEPSFHGQLASSPERTCLPWQSRFVWDCRWPLFLPAMQTAARDVEGIFDFTSFTAHDPDRAQRVAAATNNSETVTNVRNIFVSTWKEHDGLLLYQVTGSGFLHHMVRNLVGTMVEIGAGRRPADCIPDILAATNRSAAGGTAPPQGLFLMKVVYDGGQSRLALRPVTGDPSTAHTGPRVVR